MRFSSTLAASLACRNPHANGWPFEAFANAWLEGLGNGSFGDWFTFHKEWSALASRFPPSHGIPATSSAGDEKAQVLWVHYEQVVRQPAQQIARIAEFLGLRADDTLIDAVVAGSSFGAMKSAALATEGTGGRSMTAAHLRRGEIGDWRNHFVSPPVEAAFRAKFDECLRGSGLHFDIGDNEVLEARA